MKSCHFYRIAQCSSKNSMTLSSFSMTFAIFHDFPGLENGLPKFHDQRAPWSLFNYLLIVGFDIGREPSAVYTETVTALRTTAKCEQTKWCSIDCRPILIKYLYYQKDYGAMKLTKEFPVKTWKKTAKFLKPIDGSKLCRGVDRGEAVARPNSVNYWAIMSTNE